MSPRRIDDWAGVAGTLVCAAVCVPVALEQAAGDRVTVGPWWLWWLPYLVYLGVFVVGGRELRIHRSERAPVALLVAAGSITVGLSASMTFAFTAILLVFTVAAAAYKVSPAAVTAIIVLQTVVVAVTGARTGEPAVFVAMTIAIYAALQVFVALASRGDLLAARTRRELALANIELRAANALLDGAARTEERLRIARDLHDSLGHKLTVLALDLEVATHRAHGPAAEHVVRSRALAKELLADVRAVVGEVREHPTDLREAVLGLAGHLERPNLHLEVADDLRLDERSTEALIRCAQEVLVNAIRHADADNLWITVAADGAGGVRLDARDDGRGTEVILPGNGLTGLRERIEGLGGTVRYDIDDGFRVRARLPA
jgi:signal transduction histidine kinase